MPKVFSRRRPHEIPTGAIYVGRPSLWGNPFSKSSKEQNIADFREYAEKRKNGTGMVEAAQRQASGLLV